MSDEITPPPQVAAYPREGMVMVGQYGSAEKLELLYRGYHGLSYTFLFMFVTYLFLIVSLVASGANSTALSIIAGIACLASFVAIFFFSIRSCQDIGQSLSWTKATSILIGVVTPFVGIILLIVLQMLATNEMKNYGIRQRAFAGIKKKEVRELIERMRQAESASVQV